MVFYFGFLGGHNDIGIGTPPNIKKQQSMRKRLDGAEYDLTDTVK
jgi:hypothetical protein